MHNMLDHNVHIGEKNKTIGKHSNEYPKIGISTYSTPHIPDENKGTGKPVLVRQETQDNKRKDKEYENVKSS